MRAREIALAFQWSPCEKRLDKDRTKSRISYLPVSFQPRKPLHDIVDCIHHARVNIKAYRNRLLHSTQRIHPSLPKALTTIHPPLPFPPKAQTQTPTLILPLRRLPDRPHHPLNHDPAHLLPALAQPHAQVRQQRRVAHVRGVRVPVDVGRPVELGRVGVARAHVAGLQRLELLLRAELVGLGRVSGEGLIGWRRRGERYHFLGGEGWCSVCGIQVLVRI